MSQKTWGEHGSFPFPFDNLMVIFMVSFQMFVGCCHHSFTGPVDSVYMTSIELLRFSYSVCLTLRVPTRTLPWLSYWSYARVWVTYRPWCLCSPAACRTRPSQNTSATWPWCCSRWRGARFRSVRGESCKCQLLYIHSSVITLIRLPTSLFSFPPLQVALQHLLCASSDGERALSCQLREQVRFKFPAFVNCFGAATNMSLVRIS